MATATVLPLFNGVVRGAASKPPVRTITRGPKHHWFGYYDKLEFDPTDRFVLSNEVDFEGRTPRPDDVIRVGIVPFPARFTRLVRMQTVAIDSPHTGEGRQVHLIDISGIIG